MPQVLGVVGFLESLERELADRLQHPEAAVREPDEALVDQRLQRARGTTSVPNRVRSGRKQR